ncbi:DUF4007 family protein [Stenotrophomonas maltophilia]|nr:DUF4007 family protein [Stenotrophomonas maltophilia]MBH1766017.1 DUF4007 family protein [Stenotrophomonas maltophilia]MBH1774906.1 DUF4007 family protein [Stenotrophomonas maltophilia]
MALIGLLVSVRENGGEPHEYGSPGRVFKLDERGIEDRLSGLESLTDGQLRWTDTAGVRQVSRQIRVAQEELTAGLFRKAYGK